MRISPAIVLSSLILTQVVGAKDWFIDKEQTENLNNENIEKATITENGNLTVNSTGTNTINKMVMYRLNNGAGATFNVTNGKLDLDLTITNSYTNAEHSVAFNVSNGAMLNLTASKGAAQQGIFQGSSTTLTANIAGTLKGSLINNGNSEIDIKSGATMQGNIQQTGGNLTAIIDGTLQGNISFDKNVTQTSLWTKTSSATNKTSTITGNIVQQGGQLNGIMHGLTLEGSFTQTGGISDIAFHNSLFKSSTTLSGGKTEIHFYASELKNITSSNGSELTVNLKVGSKMQDYTGVASDATITLIDKSIMQNSTQTGGKLKIDSNDSTINGSITGANADITVIADSTQILGSITNTNGNTQITTSNQTNIQGNITQNKGSISSSLQDTTVQGGYTQIEGELIKLETIGSSIGQGIYLERVSGTGESINITGGSTINNGIKVKSAASMIGGKVDASTINGGYTQEGGSRVELTFDNSSKLMGGIYTTSRNATPVGDPTNPTNYLTTLIFNGGSSYAGGVNSTNHSTWIELNGNSTGDGAINITGGNGYFKATTGSTFTGNLVSNDTFETRVDLNNGNFKGNITQNNGKQHVSLRELSNLTGNITNTNTNSTFINRSGSTMDGSYYQDNGTLDLQLGGDSTTTGSFTLNNVATTISNGMATDHRETIKGDIRQNGGSFEGKIGGLTLEGKFTQTGGTSNVIFDESSDFQQETLIKDATSSNVTFDNQSNLKDYTIQDSGKNNSLLLDRQTTLDGYFKLIRSSSKLGVKRGSKITGSIFSEDKENDLEFDFTGPGSEVGGDIIVKGGSAHGTIEGTNIKGDLKLTDATTHLHFQNSSIGNVDILRGTSTITLDNTAVKGHFHMKENGPTNPTLKLKISNGSSIGEDLLFENTKAFIGGDGLNNKISGSLISNNSTLTNGGAKYGGQGDPYPNSGLTIVKGLKQTGGTLDLIFTNQSDIQDTTLFDDTKFSHITIQDNSGIGAINVNKGQDNLIIIKDKSRQNGAINLTDTKVIIKGLNQSTLVGNILAKDKDSDTTLILESSSRTGTINQNNGNLKLDFTNRSSMQGDMILKDTNLKATLDHSSLAGGIFAENSPSSIFLNNQSSYNGSINSTNSTFDIKAYNQSSVAGEINHNFNGNTQDQYSFKMEFKNQSRLDNTKMTLIGNTKITSDQSSINSALGITLTSGNLDIVFDNQSSGTIHSITTAANNKISIISDNQSNNTINLIDITDQSTLTIFANNASTLTGSLLDKLTSSSSLTALANSQLRFTITPDATAQLDINLNGGILFGSVLQSTPSAGIANLISSNGFGGRWIMVNDSALKELSISNSSANINDKVAMHQDSFNSPISMVDMTKDALGNSRIGLAITPQGGTPTQGQTQAKTLTLSNLTGNNGVFRVYTDIGSNQSDKLTTNTASGNHTVQIYYNPATFTEDLSGKYIVITHVDDEKTSAHFEGGYTDIGTQSYKSELTKVTAQGGGFDWILGKAQNTGANHGTKVITSILQSQYRSFALHAESLNQRLGELKEIRKAEGMWARYYTGSSSTKEERAGVNLQDSFYSIWAGYDHNQLDLKGQDFYGFALSYTLLSPQSKDYTGDVYNIGFNFYNTFIARNDFYVDIVAKYILSYGEYKVDYFALSKNAPEYTNHKLLISAEIGKKFKLGHSNQRYFYLKPEAQLISGYIHSNDLEFTDTLGTSIKAHLDYTFPFLARAGLFAGYSLDYGIKGDIMLGASIVYEKNTGGDVSLDDGTNTITYKHPSDFKAVLSAGTNWIFNEFGRIYLEAQTGFLGKTNIDYGLNAGVRFTFGYKNTRRLKVPGEPPPPPPKPDYDPRNIPTITDNTKADIQNNNTPKRRYQEDYFINTRKAFRDGSY